MRLCATLIVATGAAVLLLELSPGDVQDVVREELRQSWRGGLVLASRESWENFPRALKATATAAAAWRDAVYPLIVYVASAWVVIVHTFAPPLLETASQVNPLVAWIIAGVCLSVLAALALNQWCKKQRYLARLGSAYRRRVSSMKKRWNHFRGTVRRKSMLAARMLPHILFVVTFVAIVALSPAWIGDVLDDGQTIVLFGLPIPLLLSTRAVLLPDPPSTTEEMQRSEQTPRTTANSSANPSPTGSAEGTAAAVRRGWLSYWAMASFAWLIWQFPILGAAVFQRWSYFKITVLGYVLWLQLPLTNGASVGLWRLKGFIEGYVRVRKLDVSREKSAFVLRMLVGMGLISDEQRIAFVEAMYDGSSIILLGFVFFLTPGFLTAYGCLLVGTVYPMYASVASACSQVARAQKWWLVYWIVFICFSNVHSVLGKFFGWLPLWYHVRLLVIMWMQLPYTRGAEKIFRTVIQRLRQSTPSAQTLEGANQAEEDQATTTHIPGAAQQTPVESADASPGAQAAGFVQTISPSAAALLAEEIIRPRGSAREIDPGTPSVPPIAAVETKSKLRRRRQKSHRGDS